MHASPRRRAGALALAVIGILTLMAAALPGVAAAAAGSSVELKTPHAGQSWDGFETGGCGGIEPAADEVVWHFVLSPVQSGEPGPPPSVTATLTSATWSEWLTDSNKIGSQNGASVHWYILTPKAVSTPNDLVAEIEGGVAPETSGTNSSLRVSHVCPGEGEPEEEPGEYPVIPTKDWIGTEGDGFSAEITISYETEDASDSKTWTFDGEGVIDDEDPMWVPDTVDPSELTWSESFTVPESEDGEWACVAEGAFEEGQEGVTLEVTNTCDFDEDEEPEIPETPETPQTPQTPETPDTEPDELTEEPPAVEGIVVQVPVEEPVEEPVEASAGAGGVLPRTGLGSLAMAVGGLASLVSGLGLTVVGRRERD